MNTLRNLSRRKVRSALTIAGISIGVVALVVFGSMANKIDGFVNSNVDYLRGSVIVTPGTSTDRAPQPISSKALDTIRHLSGTAGVVPSVQMPVSTGDGMPTSFLPDTIVGVDPDAEGIPDVRYTSLAQGRELQASDAASNVAVLGSDVALHDQAVVGGQIDLRGEQFRVVGIYETTTAMPDSQVRIPLAAAQRIFVASLPDAYQKALQPSAVFTTVTVYTAAGGNDDQLAAQIVAAAPDTKTMTGTSAATEVGSITKLFNAILIGIALISLLIGGLSVINTMAMAVAERTREIGIKRAIGGSRVRVVREIVGESAFIGFIGGLVGLALGGAIVLVGNELGRSTNTILFDLTALTAITSVGFATVLGAVAGLVPAINAARMDPVAALRYE